MKIIDLITAIRTNDAKTAESVASSWTPAEREAVAYYLSEVSTFLRRYNKNWFATMHFPAENEE